MTPPVTVIIPTIAGRQSLLDRALTSVERQDYAGQVIPHVVMDTDYNGPSAARNAGLENADTEWVAFLDDDDELYPNHVSTLINAVSERSAGQIAETAVYYPWFHIMKHGIRADIDLMHLQDGRTPFGEPFDAESMRWNNHVPITVLARRSMLLEVGGFPAMRSERWPHSECEDWGMWLSLLDAGYTFLHVPVVTWVYHWHNGNTSGRPERARG